MNTSIKAIFSVTFAAAVQLAAPASYASDTLTIRCGAPLLPSQQAVAKALDLHNFGQVYSARDKLMRYVQRACRNGASDVFVSNDRPAGSPQVWSHTGPRMAETTRGASASEQH